MSPVLANPCCAMQSTINSPKINLWNVVSMKKVSQAHIRHRESSGTFITPIWFTIFVLLIFPTKRQHCDIPFYIERDKQN